VEYRTNKPTAVTQDHSERGSKTFRNGHIATLTTGRPS
jgi:hypothetical protein